MDDAFTYINHVRMEYRKRFLRQHYTLKELIEQHISWVFIKKIHLRTPAFDSLFFYTQMDCIGLVVSDT